MHITMARADRDETHTALLEALRDPSAYPHAVGTIEVFETHISSVLLAGDYAYKIKKPVNLGFADFSSLERRRAFCEEEIRLNRRTAPSLYLDVVPITRRSAGSGLRIAGDGAVVEYAVRMRRFGADARLDQVAAAGRLDETIIDRLATTIAVFHAQCERAPEHRAYGTAENVRDWAVRTVRQLQQLDADRPSRRRRERIDELGRWVEHAFSRRAGLFETRRAGGFVRECHGDLHLGNMALIDGAPVPFDCIEFNPALRFIDVMSDVAFTWMDLLEHRLDRHAARFLNRYLEETGDYQGLAVLRFYAVYRALVRALVALLRRNQMEVGAAEAADAEQDCTRYLELAEGLTQEPPALLVAVCGLSGSGKTTVARHLVEHLGAVCVRSDIERKRLAGLVSTARRGDEIGTGLYAASATQATYQRMEQVATTIIDAGFPAIVDATFQRRSDRNSLAVTAARSGARFALVLCEAPSRTLQSRIAARRDRDNDASDATVSVLARQVATFEPFDNAEASYTLRLDTDTDLATLAERCAALAESLPARAAPIEVLDGTPAVASSTS
jgi:aminoglycoside phosphotransferase family enzyme/predicted kinase